MDYIAFGRRIRHLRKELHITQEALAEKSGLSASFLGHIERGTRIASLETLISLCRALNTDPNHLLAFSSSKEALPFPHDMPEAQQHQLAELMYQGYLILQSVSK